MNPDQREVGAEFDCAGEYRWRVIAYPTTIIEIVGGRTVRVESPETPYDHLREVEASAEQTLFAEVGAVGHLRYVSEGYRRSWYEWVAGEPGR